MVFSTRTRPSRTCAGSAARPASQSRPVSRRGAIEQDQKRKGLNDHIRTSGLFDAVIDFDKVITSDKSGAMKDEYVPDSTIGGPGDKLHPNRAGYLAIGQAIDLNLLKARR